MVSAALSLVLPTVTLLSATYALDDRRHDASASMLTGIDHSRPPEIAVVEDFPDSPPIIRAGRTWVVRSDGLGDAPTIQAGIDSSSAGDTIRVECGTYHEHDLIMKSGVLFTSSTGQADCVDIDAEHLGRVIRCSSVDSTAAIVGFTVSNGIADYDGGGGILLFGSSPRIANCRFWHNCSSDTTIEPGGYGGGGLSCRVFAQPVITNCVFSENCAGIYWGGGGVFSFDGSRPRLQGCVFSGNRSGMGGGLAVWYAGATVTASSLLGNEAFAGQGGGLFCYSSTSSFATVIDSCTFAGNSADYGGGAVACGHNSRPAMTHTILWGNCSELTPGDQVTLLDPSSSIAFTCCDVDTAPGWVSGSSDGVTWVGQNYVLDPLFCDSGDCAQAPFTGGDYGLTAMSPCLDAPGCGLIGAWGPGCTSTAAATVERRGPFFAEVVPNPSSSGVTLLYELPAAARVTVRVYDVGGRLVETLRDGFSSAGRHVLPWSQSGADGGRVQAGVYFCQIRSGAFAATRRVVVVR